MSQHSSSIFNSSARFLRRARPMIFFVMWTFLGLLVIDVFINYTLAYPNDPKFTNPSRLQLYFEYGRSAEGQLSAHDEA